MRFVKLTVVVLGLLVGLPGCMWRGFYPPWEGGRGEGQCSRGEDRGRCSEQSPSSHGGHRHEGDGERRDRD